MSVLVTGAGGSLAKTVIMALKERDEVIGVDLRPLRDPDNFPGTFYQLKRYDHRKTAEVFRTHRPRMLIHLGVRASMKTRAQFRYTQNVMGTRHLLELCLRYGVERAAVLSSYHVYGAHEHNPVLIDEEAPLRAGHIFPQLVDAVELDHTVTNFIWRHRECSTVLLRFSNIVGPGLRNQITRLLISRRCPRLLGFDPMLQFIHREDAARAIVDAAQRFKWGVYNVSGEGTIPYSHAIRLAGGRAIPIPHVVAYPAVAMLSRTRLIFPEHLMDYFRYPTVIDDRAFRREFSWTPNYTTVETLSSLGSVPTETAHARG